jgi:GNAT superfamily N-acetyltransferase
MSLGSEIGPAPDAGLPPARAARARYTYRRLTMAELPQLNEVYNACYGRNRPLAEVEWLYRDNPNGEALIMAAFDADGELAGVRPALPWRIVWQGRVRIAYEFADALVAPRHRNQGIFTRLVKLICETADQNDYLMYTIPNENSLPIYRRTGALQVAGASETLAKPISWARYLGQRLGLNGRLAPRVPRAEPLLLLSEGDASLLPIDRFESGFEQVHSEFAAAAAAFTLRHREFLQWRYFGSPVRRYHAALVEQGGRVRGYLVMRTIDGVAHLIDVFVAPDLQLAAKVFRLAAAWARQLGAIAVHFNASKGNFFRQAALSSGYWLRKTSGTLVIDRRSAELLAASRGARPGVQDVYFVMGDFDFF